MSVIDEYLKAVGPDQREALQRIQLIVQHAVPDAQVVISYGMPGFKYKGHYLLGFAAFKQHLSLFPTSAPVEALQDKLSAFKLSKGTIQFTIDNQIPEALIKEIIAYRVSSIDKGND